MLAINPIHVDEVFLTNSLNLISWQAGNYLKPLQYKLFTRGRLKLHKNNEQTNRIKMCAEQFQLFQIPANNNLCKIITTKVT